MAALCAAATLPLQAQTYDKEPATVAWNFNSTSDYGTANTVTPEGGFATVSVNIGDIEVTGTGTGQATDASGEKVTFLKLRPSGSTKAVQWTVTPSRGFTFTPTKVSAYIARFGTDAENGVVVTALLDDGTKEDLGSFTA